MGKVKLTKQQALEKWPEIILWLEENQIEYVAYCDWMDSTPELENFRVQVKNLEDFMVVKLRWQ